MILRDLGHSKRWVHALLLVLAVLNVLDLHSSLTAQSAAEMNHAINLLSGLVGGTVALVLAKLVAMSALACLYVVWRRCPALRRDVLCILAVSVAAYSLVVASNYGASA